MLVKSANDIAVAVAETVGGSVDGFAERMNKEAARLGMTRSHFVNPHGLPDERQVTSARDMAVLARALLVDFPQHRDFLKVHAIQLGNKVFENFNPLLERYPGANGMKTGFICASGYNLVASARRGERELIAVVFGEYGGKARAEHAAELLDAGFDARRRIVPEATLANVSSGKTYATPLDMRPYVCSPKRASTASESNTEDAEKTGEAEQKVSHLTAPMYLGAPVPVDVTDPNARPGELGYAARVPRPRPGLAEIADAYAPVADAPGPAEKAIDESADEKPLLHLYSN
jgi:D-alanyl-D-alanine carboxypeptidase